MGLAARCEQPRGFCARQTISCSPKGGWLAATRAPERRYGLLTEKQARLLPAARVDPDEDHSTVCATTTRTIHQIGDEGLLLLISAEGQRAVASPATGTPGQAGAVVRALAYCEEGRGPLLGQTHCFGAISICEEDWVSPIRDWLAGEQSRRP